MWPEVIKRRRDRYSEAVHLSDWQIHSAHLVSSAIHFASSGIETGPWFVPMPTGSGKTTGAICGITELCEKEPDIRICFFAPYVETVENIYQQIVAYLGSERVGRYYSDGFEQKKDALRKQVVILTHQFLSHNPVDILEDRDVFVVDEALYATGEATVKLSDIAKAREWAEAHDIMASEFVRLSDYANSLDLKLRNENKKHVAADKPDDLSWVYNIAHNLKSDAYSQTVYPQTQGEIERWCQTMEKRVLLENYYLSGDLERQIKAFI